MPLMNVVAAMVAVQMQAAAVQPPSGAWTVDLSANPAEPYLKPMTLQLAADGTVTGDFYESEIVAGRWKSQAGRLCVAFRTMDGVGPYHTAACLVGDRVEGQTWAEHRSFVFIWSAVRSKSAPTP